MVAVAVVVKKNTRGVDGAGGGVVAVVDVVCY